MSRFHVRSLESSDFDTLMALEDDVFGAKGESALGPYYVRLCCDFFADSSFIVFDGDTPAGYVLSFVRDKVAYCTSLAIVPEYQQSRAILHLLRAFVARIIAEVDVCWFTVDEANQAARGLHRMLGAIEVDVRDDFYGAGHPRIISKIDRASFESMRRRYVRLGLIDRPDQPPAEKEAA